MKRYLRSILGRVRVHKFYITPMVAPQKRVTSLQAGATSHVTGKLSPTLKRPNAECVAVSFSQVIEHSNVKTRPWQQTNSGALSVHNTNDTSLFATDAAICVAIKGTNCRAQSAQHLGSIHTAN